MIGSGTPTRHHKPLMHNKAQTTNRVMLLIVMAMMVMMVMVPSANQMWAKCGPSVDHQATDCGMSLGLHFVCRLVYTCSTSGTYKKYSSFQAPCY